MIPMVAALIDAIRQIRQASFEMTGNQLANGIRAAMSDLGY